MNNEILKVESIVAGYSQIEVLHEVSLTVKSGEIVTVIGANGAGKTTTLMCISRIHPLISGRIWFDGIEITSLPPFELLRLGLAQVPEGRKIFPRLTVLENLRMGAFLRRDDAVIKQDLNRIFELFPVLAERLKQLGGTLSGGEQQMLAIGRALMSKPKMLLLDEPSMGIAPLLVSKIFAALAQLNKEGMTILLVEQNANQALRLATKGLVLETGRIVLEDNSEHLLIDPRVREAYLGN